MHKQIMSHQTQAEWRDHFQSSSNKYSGGYGKVMKPVAITIQHPEGMGQVWLAAQEFARNLEVLDSDTSGVLFQSVIGRPHYHGVIYTTLSNTKIRKCMRSAWMEIKRVYSDAWYNYVLEQSSGKEEDIIYIGG